LRSRGGLFRGFGFDFGFTFFEGSAPVFSNRFTNLVRFLVLERTGMGLLFLDADPR
jgi:hypothetical protein